MGGPLTISLQIKFSRGASSHFDHKMELSSGALLHVSLEGQPSCKRVPTYVCYTSNNQKKHMKSAKDQSAGQPSHPCGRPRSLVTSADQIGSCRVKRAVEEKSVSEEINRETHVRK